MGPQALLKKGPLIKASDPQAPFCRKTSFKGDVLRLVSGTGFAQILALIAAPILTRLYAPDAFGGAALFASVTGILGVVACMRYELSIVLPANDSEAANLLAVSLLFSGLIAVLTIPLIWFGGPQILQWAKMPELSSYLWLVPLMVLIQGAFTALNYWNTRTKHFTRLSIARVTSALAGTSGSVGAGLAGLTTAGSLIGANIAGQATATAVLGGQIWFDNGKNICSSLNWREIWKGMKRHRKFPLYSSWSALLNTASWMLPALMLGAFFSPAVVGFYALGFRILQVPMNLVGGAISQVFIQRAAEAKKQGTLAKLVQSLFERLVMLGMFPMLMVSIIGRDVYVCVFGADWAEAGVYTQILGVWAFFWFISSPLSTLFSVLEEQEFGLRLNVVLFLTRVFSLAAGGLVGSPRVSLVLFAATGTLIYGFLSIKIMEKAAVARKQIWSILLRYFSYFVPLGSCVIGLSVYGVDRWPILAAASLAGVLYTGLIITRHSELLELRIKK